MLNSIRKRLFSPHYLNRAQTFVVLFAVWLILDGWQAAWLGAVFAAAGTILAIILAPDHRHFWLNWRLIAFAGFFLWESVRGGADIARRALHPGLPITPEFRRHPLVLPVGEPRTLMISVVSLLPGTLSADLADQKETLIVHILVPGAETSILRLEKWIAWLFKLSGTLE